VVVDLLLPLWLLAGDSWRCFVVLFCRGMDGSADITFLFYTFNCSNYQD
jgi:hypothetical protein